MSEATQNAERNNRRSRFEGAALVPNTVGNILNTVKSPIKSIFRYMPGFLVTGFAPLTLPLPQLKLSIFFLLFIKLFFCVVGQIIIKNFFISIVVIVV